MVPLRWEKMEEEQMDGSKEDRGSRNGVNVVWGDEMYAKLEVTEGAC